MLGGVVTVEYGYVSEKGLEGWKGYIERHRRGPCHSCCPSVQWCMGEPRPCASFAPSGPGVTGSAVGQEGVGRNRNALFATTMTQLRRVPKVFFLFLSQTAG